MNGSTTTRRLPLWCAYSLLPKWARMQLFGHAPLQKASLESALAVCSVPLPRLPERLDRAALRQWCRSHPALQALELRQKGAQSGIRQQPNAHVYPEPGRVAGLLRRLQRTVAVEPDALKRVWWLHAGMVWIHPLADGNGRLGRALFLAGWLRMDGAPILLDYDLPWRKQAFQRACKAWNTGDFQPMLDFHQESLQYSARLWQQVESHWQSAGLPASGVYGVEVLRRVFSLQDWPMLA